MRQGIATSLRRASTSTATLRRAAVRPLALQHHSQQPHSASSASSTATSFRAVEAHFISRRSFASSSIVARPQLDEIPSKATNKDDIPSKLATQPLHARRRGTGVTGGKEKGRPSEGVKNAVAGQTETVAKATGKSTASTSNKTQPLERTTKNIVTAETDAKTTSQQTQSTGETSNNKLHASKERPTDAVTKASDTAAQPAKTIGQRIRGIWENVKYMVKFYWDGMKQIYRNHKVVQEMRLAIREREEAGLGGIRWTERAMIDMQKSDVRKLPLFVLILLILEEILPLVVIYAPGLLPSTCVLPSQALKMREKEEQRRGAAVQRMAGNAQVRSVVDSLVGRADPASVASLTPLAKEESESDPSTPPPTPQQQLTRLEGTALSDIAGVFGLHGWGPRALVARRIAKHIAFLQEDDALLQAAWHTRRNGGDGGDDATNEWTAICSSAWLWRASGRRGLRASAADEAAMERNLEAYLHLSQSCTATSSTVTRALLPLALYDGTPELLHRLQARANEEHAKGLRKRTKEVVESVVEEAKRKEGNKEAK